MSKSIKELDPNAVWQHFYDLTQIPRPSKKEHKVVEHVKKFAESNGLEYKEDDTGNVVVKKPATKGMEDKKRVILQAHLDMVPQKNSGTDHDFENDPIKAYVDGEWVTADGTTLGADNGMGVAAALAVLESQEIKHGPLEALFTIDEETGLTGAFGIQPNFIEGDVLLNLDSEEEGELTIGCAGGVESNSTLPYNRLKTPAAHTGYNVSVTGLKGGHSGTDIQLGRGNSVKLLNRFLKLAARSYGIRLSEFNGGDMRNAIPREAFATVSVPNESVVEFEKYAETMNQTYRDEIGEVDPNVTLSVEKTDLPEYVIERQSQTALFDAIYANPHGVMRMSTSIEGLVETSVNLAVVNTNSAEAKFKSLLRSSVDTAKHDLSEKLRSVMELAGAEITFSGEYPGWKPNTNSYILNKMKEIYNNEYGKVPEVKAIHAGLETGLLGSLYSHLDMISFGPTISFPHSPDEKVNIETVGKFWNLLVKTLENID